MLLHRNANLGLGGRYALVLDVERAARCRKRRGAMASRRRPRAPGRAAGARRGAKERLMLSCLFDRSSRPHGSPRMLVSEEQVRICAERRRSGHGASRDRGAARLPARDGVKTLRLGGCSRAEAKPREPARRYEWPCPGDLLHVDYTRLDDARPPRPKKRRRIGYDFVHAIVDDDSRLAYGELLPEATAKTVTGFLQRALALYAEHGMRAAPTDERQRELEWEYGLAYASSDHRRRALPCWLDHYNRSRPNSSLKRPLTHEPGSQRV